MVAAILSAAVWVVLNTAIVIGALWLWDRGPRTARRAQGMVFLTSILLLIPGLVPLLDQHELFQRAVFVPFAFGFAAIVLSVVLDIRDRFELRRRRQADLLNGYPHRPRIIGGWGAFWIGTVTSFVASTALLVASFLWSWVGALIVVADGGPDRWDGSNSDVSTVMACVGIAIGIIVGVVVWARGIARERYWERLKAGIEHRESVAAQRAVENHVASNTFVE